MSQVNRRTVVRGAAWSIPVVAVASTAPAYAASTDAPSINGTNSFVACKDPGTPGGANCQGYRIALTLSVQPGDTWTITLTDVKVEGQTLTASQTVYPNVSTSNPTVNIVICTATDSASHHNFTIRYSATNNRTGVTTQNLGGTYDVSGISPCK